MAEMFDRSFDEWHVLAIRQAICEQWVPKQPAAASTKRVSAHTGAPTRG